MCWKIEKLILCGDDGVGERTGSRIKKLLWQRHEENVKHEPRKVRLMFGI